MTLEQVIAEAQRLYPDLKLKPSSARMWTARGLIPSPSRHSLGRSKGTQADYPDGAPAQVAAAALLQEMQFTQAQIALARSWVLDGIPLSEGVSEALHEAKRDPQQCHPAQALHADNSVADQVAAVLSGVLNEAHSPAARQMERCVRLYARKLAMAMGDIPVTASGFGEWIEVKLEARRLLYIVSVPGAYFDPRHADRAPDIALDLDRQIREKLHRSKDGPIEDIH